MGSSIILSICIPTYNHAESLLYSLRSVIDASSGFQEFVEIIVSNNCSTDRTNEILESFNSIPNFKFFTNQSNIGFNLNYFKLIDEYSSGKYCWIVGDDDFLNPNSVEQVLTILALFPELDFIYTNYETKSYQSIIANFDNSFINHSRKIQNIIENNGQCIFNELLNKNPRPTNILLTYISASIFNRRLLKEFDKSIFSKESWVTFRDLFPHSYMFASLMINRKAYYFKKPLVTAAIQAKGWDQNLPALYLKYIPELFQFYKSKGFSKKELCKTHELIAYGGILNFFKNFRFNLDSIKARLVFLKYYLFDLALLSAFVKLFSKFFKKLISKRPNNNP